MLTISQITKIGNGRKVQYIPAPTFSSGKQPTKKGEVFQYSTDGGKTYRDAIVLDIEKDSVKASNYVKQKTKK